MLSLLVGTEICAYEWPFKSYHPYISIFSIFHDSYGEGDMFSFVFFQALSDAVVKNRIGSIYSVNIFFIPDKDVVKLDLINSLAKASSKTLDSVILITENFFCYDVIEKLGKKFVINS